MGRNVTNKHTHVIKDYPKWIEVDGEQVLIKDEEHDMEFANQAEKDKMVKELTEDYGKEVDLRSYKGANGFAALKAYYEAVISREGEN